VDGIEGTSAAAGCDLFEFADPLRVIELGVHWHAAMNLDGGGSTAAVLNGKTYNTPHCADTWEVCERDVTSITCVKA
jgi:exopolysaccharide biosynthesis protein